MERADERAEEQAREHAKMVSRYICELVCFHNLLGYFDSHGLQIQVYATVVTVVVEEHTADTAGAAVEAVTEANIESAVTVVVEAGT